MRVLHLTTEFPPVIYGGLGTAVGGWVTASARAGMTMGVLLVEGELVIDDAAEAGVRLARRWRPDVIHLHTAMVWPVAQAIQRQTSLPLVYHVHSVDKAEYEIGQEPQPWLAHSEAQEQ